MYQNGRFFCCMRAFFHIHIDSRHVFTIRILTKIFLSITCSIIFLSCIFIDWSVPYMPGISQEKMIPYSYEEVMNIIENGDILITFDSHFLNWRNGHAGIVVDATNGTVLEAKTLGINSSFANIKRWSTYNSFAILRLTAVSYEERAKIASFAQDRLVNVPYSLLPPYTSFPIAEDISLSGTHCSHLIWLSFMQYGYDLDSDGGIIVTPRDIYNSEHLQKIVVYINTK